MNLFDLNGPERNYGCKFCEIYDGYEIAICNRKEICQYQSNSQSTSDILFCATGGLTEKVEDTKVKDVESIALQVA